MLATLLFGTALAAPPQLGLAIGPVMGGGESTHGSYFSAAPASAVTVTWHLGPLESWVGASGSLLLAGSGDDVVPAALIQGEVGVGFGGRAVGAGIYGGNGFPGPLVGLYARATVGRPGWIRRVGLEARLFHGQATDSNALALMLRLEPGRPRGARRVEVEVSAREEEAPAETRGAESGQAVPAASATDASATEVSATEGPASEGPATEAAPATPAEGEPRVVEVPLAVPAAEPGQGSTAAEPASAGSLPATHHDEPF